MTCIFHSKMQCSALDGGEVLLGAVHSGLHGLLPRLPPCGAHLIRVVLDVLQSLEHTQGLVNIATEGQVVNGGMLHNTLAVDDEETAQGNTICGKHAEGLADLALQIGHQRVGEVAQAALITGSLDPGQMGELGVHGHAQHLGVQLLELLILVAEGGDLSGANEGEVQRVEEQHNVLALQRIGISARKQGPLQWHWQLRGGGLARAAILASP